MVEMEEEEKGAGEGGGWAGMGLLYDQCSLEVRGDWGGWVGWLKWTGWTGGRETSTGAFFLMRSGIVLLRPWSQQVARSGVSTFGSFQFLVGAPA